ncbi:hypothetical protein AGABI2DRAFT_122728 [Agaricus bisporus var. bisporus H97]|uniref:hypothetical protein n=1 Tax=Agaricus bisporus var. bisporus (strain H97 / ATCC MYA-4626 / FGSC 10389) TaxID=936046 RepID=UPI00029F61ED|nr:hypothetical protein AGABI2DRAFT_122728 [Agaricus bisporus var. bisporus H97]EKV42503.1 hypothetical protein AGABI2DRAFT_122728 [Agaricus bisporus var. bisporus H97]
MSKIPDSASQDPYGQPEEPDRLILKAKEIFSEARADTENVQKFFDLSDEGAPIEEQEKCLVPLFQKLVFLVTGRKDVDLAPPVVEYIIPFRTLLDQRLLKRASDRSNNKKESPEDIAIRRLTNYIIKEDEKLRKIESNKSSAVTRSVEQAWETGYVGETDRLLRDAISSMYSKSSSLPYANFCPIIQGSGTGKSRLVDKLAESVFTIPITLRPLADDKGFPLGDTANGKALLDFFCKPEYFTSALHAQLYYLQFLLKSLAIAGNWIDDYKRSGRGTENIAAEWRQHLGTPRTAPRNHLYGQATDPSALETFEDILDESVRFIDLQARVKNFVGAITDKIKSKTDKGPVILFYFDEAQHLTAFTVTKGEKEPRRTAYQCLCKAFTYMLDVPVFTLFLSTYSRLSEFSPSARNFWSARLLASTSKESNDNLNAPFVELPFDAWKSPTIVKEGSHSGDEICSLRFMARFGRPMFWALFESPDATDSQVIGLAMSKLKLHFEDTRKPYNIHTYDELIPLLAARVDFTFESNRDEAVFLEGLLVASAMRTVYSVPKHRQYLRGGYPSEPLLAEAAARAILAYFRSIAEGKASITTIITQYKYDIPLAVSAWFQRGLIDKGSRGELVARMLCTLAHDISILKKLTDGNLDENASFSQMITVADFFRALIAEEYVDKVLDAQPGNSTKGEPLKKVFENAYVHFTQFVKAGDKSAMTDTAAYLLFTRGAAIQGHGTMPDVDFIIPVWIRGDSNPDRWSMTAIFIQVKNRKAKQTIHIDMQKKHKFFTKGKERPYITIAMQLGLSVENKSKDKLVKVSPPHVKKLRDNKEKYPRYEISIDGCSNKTYNVIGDASATYSALLAERDILSEHPREGKFLDAVKRMKPFWKLESYNWASIRKSLDPHAKDQPEDWLVGLDRGQKGEENRLITDLSGLHIES